MLKHILLAAALTLPATAFAQGIDAPSETMPLSAEPNTGADHADIFSSLDANADGAMTTEEAASNDMVAQGFTAADTNQDGNLSEEEYEAAFGGAG